MPVCIISAVGQTSFCRRAYLFVFAREAVYGFACEPVYGFAVPRVGVLPLYPEGRFGQAWINEYRPARPVSGVAKSQTPVPTCNHSQQPRPQPWPTINYQWQLP